MTRLKLTGAALVATLAVKAFAQCLVPIPSAPPRPVQLTINLPLDGGSVGCSATANVPGGQAAATYPIGNAKCATAVAIAQQAAANDNGWNDGGTP